MLLEKGLARVDYMLGVIVHSFLLQSNICRIAGMQEPIPEYRAEGRETWICGGFTIYLNLTLVLMW